MKSAAVSIRFASRERDSLIHAVPKALVLPPLLSVCFHGLSEVQSKRPRAAVTEQQSDDISPLVSRFAAQQKSWIIKAIDGRGSNLVRRSWRRPKLRVGLGLRVLEVPA